MRVWLLACACVSLSFNAAAGQVAADRLDALVPSLLDSATLPGLSVAWVDNGTVAWTGAYGVADRDTGTPVTDSTVFEAASLSKPVVAYVTLRLAARGELDLDEPLWATVQNERLAHDPRARSITPRMVLTHRSGLPNWGATPLHLNHAPDSIWSYSGEGFVYLAQVLAERSGQTLDALARQEVFEPLGMERSAFVWRKDYERLAASPHDILGRPGNKQEPVEANAAASLHTTAGDYGRFLGAVLTGSGLPTDHAGLLTQVQAEIGGWGDPTTWDDLGWSLGWGVERHPSQPAIWHWGDNGTFRCFVIGYPDSGKGMVYLTNSENGLAVARDLVTAAFPGTHASLDYLGYDSWDEPARQARIRLGQLFLDGDVGQGWPGLERMAETLPIDRAVQETVRLGRLLIEEGRVPLGMDVLEWGTVEWPSSAAVQEALADGFTRTGELTEALARLDEAISLDPSRGEALAGRRAWLQQGIDARSSDYAPTRQQLEELTGEFGPRSIRLVGDSLTYARDGATRRTRLVPLAPDLFGLAGNPTFRLEFERDQAGQIVAVLGRYSDGRTDRSPKTEGL